jgi:tetratricopeptide (TPR) repeat protein
MSSDISEEAHRLHQEGRAAGSSGDPVRAIELFHRAHQLAPEWPYPPYDMAFTYLLHDYLEQAETWYAKVDELAPRGFFTAKTSLDTIRRERRGELFDGFSKAFALLEWEPEEARRKALGEITQQYPAYAPAWKDLALLLDEDGERLQALECGLAASPDDETYGLLVLNKALVLDRRGARKDAVRLLRALLADPRCTEGAEAMASMTLQGLSS